MPLSKEDRLAFSLQIVSAAEQIKAFETAKAQVQGELGKLQALDDANKNLFTPSNLLINTYQGELGYINGVVRTTFTEQDIQDSANRKIQNHFFPNDTSASVPSLSGSNNVWTKIPPFALGFGIGKKYNETFNSYTNHELFLIPLIQSYTEFIPTPMPGSGTPIATVEATVNDYLTTLALEVATITANDPNTTKQTQNNAALNNINTVLIPALNAYLSGHDLAALQTAVTNRNVFLTTRISQLNANLGTIVQDLTDGSLTTSTGLYGMRYGFLSLRLNALGGSLTRLNGLKTASGAQTAMISNINQNRDTYNSILPTTPLSAPGNGTNMVQLVDVSFLSPGDTVYIMAENQQELQRAIKSIVGKMVTLNDIVPAKYKTTDKLRLYKDLT